MEITGDEESAEKKMQESIFVTDNGANIVSALSAYERISCFCHNLNLAMHDVFDDVECPIWNLIDDAKHLVQYFKQLGLNSHLSKTLKQEVITRWNTIFVMLGSVSECGDEVQQILVAKDIAWRPGGLSRTKLLEVTEFLKLFKRHHRIWAQKRRQPSHTPCYGNINWRNIAKWHARTPAKLGN